MNTTRIITLLIISVCLVSCGNPVPRKDIQDLPSRIEIVTLDTLNNQIKLRVSHRNRITREQNQLSCQLAIKDQPNVQINSVPVPDLTTYAVEIVDSTVDLSPLNLQPENTPALPYVLDCFLFSTNFKKEQVINKSIIYQTPGNKNLYR